MGEVHMYYDNRWVYAGYVKYHKDGPITYGGGKADGKQYGNQMKILGAKVSQNPTARIQRQFQGRKKK